MLNYQEVIANLTDEKIIHILEQLNIPYRNKDTYIVCPTVCHNIDVEEASWKLYYYKNNKIFYCYTECGAMSIFKFLEHYYETRQIDYDWYNDIYLLVYEENKYAFNEIDQNVQYRKKSDEYKPIKPNKLKEYSKGVLDCFVKEYPAVWLNEGITKHAMDKFDIRFSISQNKIIIPHLDVDGRLVGIRGRALNEEDIENFGKYMPVKVEQTWYSHPLSLNLYGLYYNKDNIRKKGICYIAEGEKSVLLAENFKAPNCCVAVCGSNFNKFILKILMKECAPNEIIICFDNEEKPGESIYFNKLFNICKRYSQYCNFSFIYDRNGLTNLKDSPFDRGEEIFNQLLRSRVHVNAM